MSNWPESMKVGPIREWPGDLTADREISRFRVSGPGYMSKPTPLTTTLGQLEVELRALGAREVELLVAIAPADFRLDGKPRAQAKAMHPGVILSFDSNVGHLSYPCDTFTTWQDNLRAVALALEALRKVDRYGVTKRGEQYRGFLAIEANAMPAGFTTTTDAIAFLASFSDAPRAAEVPPRLLLRLAQRRSHPDHGGTAETFQRVTLAEQYLKQNGAI